MLFFRDAIVEEETFRILSEAIEKLPTQNESHHAVGSGR